MPDGPDESTPGPPLRRHAATLRPGGRGARAAGAIELLAPLLERFLPRAAILISVLTLGSYVMGLVRDRVLTQTFGAGTELDTYNAAFVLPELTLRVVVASGVAAPFIPIFARLRRDDRAAAHAFGQTILTLAVLAMGVAAAVLFVVAPLTVDLVAPGFSGEQRVLYTDLFRAMTITPVIFAASLALGEILVAEKRFLPYALAPILYNAGIVIGTVVLAGSIGIFGAAVGAILGALLHLAIRLWGIRRLGFQVRPRLAVRTAAIREFIVLMLPKTGGSPIEPLTYLFFTNIASTLVAGSVTAINLAQNFQALPVSLIGVAFSLAAFPTLAAAHAGGDRRAFTRTLGSNLISIGALTVTASIGLYLVAGVAIDILFGGGRFDAEAVSRTSLVLGVFALSVPFESLSHLLSRAIYATRHTFLQVVASIVGFAVMIIATTSLVGALDIVAIPLGFAIGSAVKAALLVIVLVPRIRAMPAEATGDSPGLSPGRPGSSARR